MMEAPKNSIASIQARLNNMARVQGRTHQELLQYYAIERFLYRLSESEYRDRFVLKGGVVFIAWRIPLRRPTRDIDLHGRTPYQVTDVIEIVKSICLQTVSPDGLDFDVDSVQGEIIQGRAELAGVRIRFTAYLGNARIPMRMDVGFADIVVPPSIQLSYPSLLNMPEPNLKAYTFETLIAEKFQAMVFLGNANSRMKDFHDLWLLANEAAINGASLYDSIKTTFKTRGTEIPIDIPVSLTQEFAKAKQRDWQTFIERANVEDSIPSNFSEVVEKLSDFIMPLLKAIRMAEGFSKSWSNNRWQ